jgi:hypothetical protein
MSTIIAETYILELKAWQKMLTFYNNQLAALKYKLFQAVKAPILLRDGARFETYQVHIIALQDYFFDIEESIQQQLELIDTKYFFDDVFKNESIEHQQLLLRYKMYNSEKKYLSFRYTLSQYLISIFEVLILNKLNNHLPNLSPIGRRFTNITV